MAKKPDLAADLSAKMALALEAERARGGNAYPVLLGRLHELADAAAPPELAFMAFKRPPLTDRAIVAKQKSATAPVALREDLEAFAASRQLLEFALDGLYAAGTPPWPVKKLSGKLEKPLRAPFEAALSRQVNEGTLPETVAAVTVRGKAAVYFKHRPPPKPPEVELAEHLVCQLETQRQLGPAAYPIRMSRLVELAGQGIALRLLPRARKSAPFATRVALLTRKPKDPLIVLAEDVERAAGSPVVLTFLLETSRTATARAFTLSELKGPLAKPAQAPFGDWVNRQIEARALPVGVGWIGARRQRFLFFLEDVRGRLTESGMTPPAPPAPAADFDTAFDDAFMRLDRRVGSHNFVSLVELRRALAFDRATFDTGLARLRRAGHYSLSAAEGRHGLTEEQRAAGITEDGTLLLYVSRR
jgi:hypothetical protein